MLIEQGKTYIWTAQVEEGEMKTTFKVLEDNTTPFRLEGDPRPHYMCEILKVTVEGEEVTDQYIKKAFDGERVRGIPPHKLEDEQVKERSG